MSAGFASILRLPALKKKIFYTLGLLFVYRIGVHVPTPGINSEALASFFSGIEGTIFSVFNMFSGGALERLSVFALGIMPYISASIILQLLTVVIPKLEILKNEGERGRKKITQYTRYGTILLSLIQGLGISIGLEGMLTSGGTHIVICPGWKFRAMTILTLTAGTAFIMWLGEQITEKGIGNGISLIIFAGIVARMPSAIINTFRLVSSSEVAIFTALFLLLLVISVVGVVVFIEQGQRRISVQYPKRVVGRRMYGGQATHLPLKINTSGVIPPIFASSIIMFPATIASFVEIEWIRAIADSMRPGNPFYELLYIAFIFFFCYFYTAITFNPSEVANSMKKNGGYVPGMRPGKKTAEYIDKVLTRITLGGAIYVSLVCVLPSILVAHFNVPFYFGGTALLIVVGVAIDTMGQMESHMLTRRYDGFLKKN